MLESINSDCFKSLFQYSCLFFLFLFKSDMHFFSPHSNPLFLSPLSISFPPLYFFPSSLFFSLLSISSPPLYFFSPSPPHFYPPPSLYFSALFLSYDCDANKVCKCGQAKVNLVIVQFEAQHSVRTKLANDGMLV